MIDKLDIVADGWLFDKVQLLSNVENSGIVKMSYRNEFYINGKGNYSGLNVKKAGQSTIISGSLRKWYFGADSLLDLSRQD